MGARVQRSYWKGKMKEIQELYGYLIMYKHLTDSDVTKALDLLKNIENNTIDKSILKRYFQRVLEGENTHYENCSIRDVIEDLMVELELEEQNGN